MKNTPFLILSLMSLAALPMAGQASPLAVTHLSYRGWPEAVRVSNGTVDVVVVPRIGRIMAFHFTGHPETSPLFNNRLELGKAAPAPRPYPKDWANFGGDKLWPSAQSDWFRHQPLAWPPDPSLEFGPYQVTHIHNGIRLTGPVSPYYQLRIIRDITLRPRRAAVDIRDTFVKSPTATGKGDDFLVGIWSVTQVRGDAMVYLPLNRHGLFPGVGYTPLSDHPLPQPNWKAAGDLLTVTRPTDHDTKVGVDDSAGWLACVYGGNLLFSEHFTRLPHALYPDKGTNAQVYTRGDATTPYIEMECLDRQTHLRAGRRLMRMLSWRLQRLPLGSAAVPLRVQRAVSRP